MLCLSGFKLYSRWVPLFKSLRKNERPHNVNRCNDDALVQKEKMVTVITCLYYVFEFTEFPRTGMCTTPNSSTNQGPWVRTLIHVMYIRHIMSSSLLQG